MNEKKCQKCEKVKNLTDFYKNATRSDKHDNYCRECRKVANISYEVKKDYKAINKIKKELQCQKLD